MSATRREDGSYEIDAAELARVFTVTPATSDTPVTVVRLATPEATHVTPALDAETAARLAAAEAELRALKEMLGDLRQQRDAWQRQAERLALTPPSASETHAETMKPWWRRLVG